MQTVNTWADGYGVWHASVPVSDNSEQVANHGTMVYRETWPDEFSELAE